MVSFPKSELGESEHANRGSFPMLEAIPGFLSSDFRLKD